MQDYITQLIFMTQALLFVLYIAAAIGVVYLIGAAIKSIFNNGR